MKTVPQQFSQRGGLPFWDLEAEADTICAFVTAPDGGCAWCGLSHAKLKRAA